MQQYADQATVQAEQLAASSRQAAAITPGSQPWDVIVVGSGAAGGMAAFQLATAGVKVLLLEAGRLLDPAKEYRTMEWPYRASAAAVSQSTSTPSTPPSTGCSTGPTGPCRSWPASRR